MTAPSRSLNPPAPPEPLPIDPALTEPVLAERPPWVRIAMGATFAIGMLLAYALLPLTEWLTDLAREIRALGALGVLAYAGGYVVASLFLFPAAILTITAGFAWGTFAGLAIAVPSSTLASITAFLIGRFLFRGKVRRMLLRKPKLSAVERAINAKGARLVFLMRFSPVLPFPILNYVLGLTRIRFPAFALATALGMIPISLMYTYIGEIGAQLGGLDGQAGEIGDIKIILGVIGAVATAGITIWVGRAARAAMREVEAETRPQVF